MFVLFVLFWLVFVALVCAVRLSAPIARYDEDVIDIKLSVIGKRDLVLERRDLISLGQSTLFGCVASLYLVVHFQSNQGVQSDWYPLVFGYSFVQSVALAAFWFFLARELVRNKPQSARNESWKTLLWKMPLAVVYYSTIAAAEALDQESKEAAQEKKAALKTIEKRIAI